jgi:hypothetical protein
MKRKTVQEAKTKSPEVPPESIGPDPFDFRTLVNLCRDTSDALRARLGRVADSALAARNWMIGRYIVEFEQNGQDRAEYGTGLLDRLSAALGKGFSARNLRQFRAFYLHRKEAGGGSSHLPTLPDGGHSKIRQTPSAELLREFTLGWSHYVELLTIDSAEERRFYEIEATAGQWSVRELQRQIASSLYQRLALSKDKDAIRRLATEGQVVEKPADLIKNPLILEFLGLEDRPLYS